MLPEFYIEYFKTYLPSSEFLTLQILGKAVTSASARRGLRGLHLAFGIRLNVRVEEKRYNGF